MLYLSTIMDTYNSEIVAFQLSNYPDAKLVLDTLEQIEEFLEGAILHSNQGATYTSTEFCKATQKNVIRSMFRKGTPSDNA